MAAKYKNRKPITLTLSPDTVERLEQYAFETHTNKSQAVANLIWQAKVSYSDIRGQMSLNIKGVDTNEQQAKAKAKK